MAVDAQRAAEAALAAATAAADAATTAAAKRAPAAAADCEVTATSKAQVAARLKELSAASESAANAAAPAAAGAPTALFKRKGGTAKKQIRTQRITTDAEDALEKDNFEETKLMQKLRTRVKGVASVVDVVDAPAAAAAAGGGDGAPGALGTIVGPGGINNTDGAAVERKLGLSVFQKEHSEQAVVDVHQEKWIAEQLAKRQGGAAAAAAASSSATAKAGAAAAGASAAAAADWKASEEDLYRAPELLKANAMYRRDGNDMEESGERWLTGIAEVALPISDKLKNIEATELAKQKLMAERAAGQPASAAVPGNLSSNFKHHKREWDMAARAAGRGERSDFGRGGSAAGRGGGFGRGAYDGNDLDVRGMPKRQRDDGGGGGGGGRGGFVPHATDDRVVDRFIKRQRTRGR